MAGIFSIVWNNGVLFTILIVKKPFMPVIPYDERHLYRHNHSVSQSFTERDTGPDEIDYHQPPFPHSPEIGSPVLSNPLPTAESRRENLNDELDSWVPQANFYQGENRLVAKNRMLDQLENILDNGPCKLDLSNLNLTGLPSDLSSLIGVTELDLGGNLFTELPPSIGDLDFSLEILSIQTGELSGCLPNWINNLKLKKLVINNTNVNNLPAYIKRHGILANNLLCLNLDGNRIKEIPDSIHCLSGLRELNLQGNCLERLPSTIRYLNALETLDIRNNHFSSLPYEIVNLPPECKIYLTKRMVLENRVEDLRYQVMAHNHLEENLPKFIWCQSDVIGST